MKRPILILLTAAIFIFSYCDKDPASANNLEGWWVPDGIENISDMNYPEEFGTLDIFGSDAGCFKLNADGTFIPVRYVDPLNFTFLENEKGVYAYLVLSNQISFKGTTEVQYTITKLTASEMWLNKGVLTLKFRKR